MLTEAELVEGLKRNAPRAFEHLITQQGSMLYRVASRFVGVQDAEEVLQDTLLTVYEKIQTFDGRAKLSTWLYRVVVNVALTRLRKNSRVREEVRDFGQPEFTQEGAMRTQIEDWHFSPENDLLRREALAVLERAIADLPDTYRATYALAEIEGLSHQEVAEILEMKTGTVKTRVHRARLFLRKALGEYFRENVRTSDL